MTTKNKRRSRAKPTKGVTIRCKEVLIERGVYLPVDDLVAALEGEGYKPSRVLVTTLASDFRQSVRVLDSKGKLKGLEVDPRPRPEREAA